MSQPSPEEIDEVIQAVAAEANRYLTALPLAPVGQPGADEVARSFDGPLPERGEGALASLRELIERGTPATVGGAGPRFFHFVQGGVTPAALGADWLASTWDQNSWTWIGGPLTTELETVSLTWLLDLFGLPEQWGGVLTTGATGANLVGLAAARRWWGEHHGRDVDLDGLTSLPPVPVFASGFVHPSDAKALAILGIGRGSIRRCSRDAAGRLDLALLEQGLRDLDGAPSIVIGSAGEVNAGEFDPLAAMADLAERYGAWLHVDGAFGLFAQLSPATSHLTDGIVRADSVTADGHKWLNVPYDCGFAFVRDPDLLLGTFSLFAAYLAAAEERPSYGLRGPESSRRARSLTVWATLRAYGRQGYRELIERHVALARHLADVVDAADDLERLADVPLNIVCFRYRPPGAQDGPELDALNRRIGEAAIEDGRVYFGTTTYEGRVAFRPAIVNWRTSEADVELVAHVVREIGARLREG